MKIVQLFLLYVVLIGSLHSAAQKEGRLSEGFFLPPFVEKSSVKVHAPGDVVASGESYKKPHIIVDGMPYLLTADNLQVFFGPCSVFGNYAPVVEFFYNELPKYLPCDQMPALKWLGSIKNDPIFIYLYLRHCAEMFTAREYTNLSYAEVIDFWVKRYTAEILLKIDLAALNLNKENADQYVALKNIESIIDRYINKLDIFMKGFSQAIFSREAVLKAVIQEINLHFLGTADVRAQIDWHGPSSWLLTTKIGSTSLGTLTLGYFGGTHFLYGSMEENKAMGKTLGLTKKSLRTLYPEAQEIARNVLMPLLKEVNQE